RLPNHWRIRDSNHRSFLRGAVDGRDPERPMALAFKRRIHRRRVRIDWNRVHIPGAFAYATADRLCRRALGLDLAFIFSPSLVRKSHGGRDRLPKLSFAIAVPDRRRNSLFAFHRDSQCVGRGHVHHARVAETSAESLTVAETFGYSQHTFSTVFVWSILFLYK